MNRVKVHTAGTEEVIYVTLNPNEFPIAYGKKLEELINSGMDEEEARAVLLQPIELELYYDMDRGMFAVESEPAQEINMFNPFTKEMLVNDELLQGKFISETEYYLYDYRLKVCNDNEGVSYIEVFDEFDQHIVNYYGVEFPDSDDFESKHTFEGVIRTLLDGDGFL